MLKKIHSIFNKTEIKAINGFLYEYIPKKKIVVFVPLEFVDKLMYDMNAAGAGLIGNYELCSFRMKGLGTYKPGSGAKPFKGRKNKISYEEEIRLEMECPEEKLDAVLDAMLAGHPYEEVAYEIYDFQKRTDTFSGYVIELKRSIPVKQFIPRIHKIISPEYISSRKKLKKIAVIENEADGYIIASSVAAGCDAILSLKKFFTIFKIL